MIGAPRSGTSWLQSMLGAHPEAATTWELHLFDDYIRLWRDRWSLHLSRSRPQLQHPVFYGLPSVFTEEEFDALITDAVAQIHRRIMSHKPSARVLVEKCPEYSCEIQAIARHVPQPRFVHVIRDGRDVADSLTRAARGWGSWWAPRSVEGAARRWREYVEGARGARRAGHAYLEIRYEALLAPDGPARLAEVLAFCEIEASTELCTDIYKRFASSRIGRDGGLGSSLIQAGQLAGRADVDTPHGFVRPEGSRGWQTTWSAYDRWWFDRVAGELLRELGYAEPEWPAAVPAAKAIFLLRSHIGRRLIRPVRRLARASGAGNVRQLIGLGGPSRR